MKSAVERGEEMVDVPRFVVAGTRSGVGKTTVALGLLGALRSRGLRVQPFKIGPDYIDGTFLAEAAGRPSRNLDTWLLSRSENLRILQAAGSAADLSILEGVMGLFDGRGPGDAHSTAHVARITRTPVVLVVDAWASSTSVGAEALGFARFDSRVRIVGVVANRVSGERHARTCKESVRRAGLAWLGALPSEPRVALPERYLGLVPAQEGRSLPPRRRAEALRVAVALVTQHVDLERVLRVAESAEPLAAPREAASRARATTRKKAWIGVAHDAAFHFYYRDALEALQQQGAHLRFFSPLTGEFPECDGVYIGGGFPETHLDELEASPATRQIHKFANSGAPVLAECGGLMYLTRRIEGADGNRGRMVGFLDAETRMVPKLTLAYTMAHVLRDCLLAPRGASFRGHEFHQSAIEGVPRDARFAYRLVVGSGIDGRRDGWTEGGVLASYMHSHLAAGTKARRFVNAAKAAR